MIPLFFIFGAAGVMAVILLFSGIYFARCAGNPRKMVERTARRRGLDPLAHVTDETAYFRSVRRWSLFGAFTCLVASVVVGFVLYRGICGLLESDLLQSIS
jgi:hypothetical protein